MAGLQALASFSIRIVLAAAGLNDGRIAKLVAVEEYEMQKWLVVAVSVAFLAIVGCNSEQQGGGAGAATYTQYQQQGAELMVQAWCRAALQCPEKQDPGMVTSLGRYSSRAECTDALRSQFDGGVDEDVLRGLEAGRIEYNAGKASACLDKVRQLVEGPQCPVFTLEIFFDDPACEDVLSGTIPTGEPCLSSNSCVSSHCDDSDPSTCYGTCKELPPGAGKGEACGSNSCDDTQNLVCAPGPSGSQDICIEEGSRGEGKACHNDRACAAGLFCQSSACLPPAQVVGEGQSCNLETTICQSGFVCVDLQQSGGTVEGTCAAPRAKDEDCRLTAQCVAGLFCKKPEGASTGTLGACSDPMTEEGVFCRGNQECGGGLSCHYNSSAQESQCLAEKPEDDEQVCQLPGAGGGGDAGTDAGGDAGGFADAS